MKFLGFITKQQTCFIILISVISFLALGKSLEFALNGDDWLALWRYIKDFTNLQSYLDIKNYSNTYSNYTFANLLMGLIYRIFHFNPFPYYLISILLRMIAALSFYFAIHSATKNKLAGMTASIFFSTMYAGIESTNWVFNMNTYLAIALLNTFFYLFFKEDSKTFYKKTVLQAFILTSCFFIAPTRMHGLLLIIPLICILKVRSFKKDYFKFLVRLSIFYIPILIIRFITSASFDGQYVEIFTQVRGKEIDFLFTLFSNLGNSLIFDKTLLNLIPTNSGRAILAASFYLILIIFFYKYRARFTKLTDFGLLSLVISISFLIIPQLISPTSFLSTDHRYQIVPASYLFTALAVLFSILWKSANKNLKGIIILIPILIIIVNFLTLRSYFNNLANTGRLESDVNNQFTFIMSQLEKPKNQTPLVILFIPDDISYLYNAISFGFSFHMMLIDSRFGLDYQHAPLIVDNLDSLTNVLSGEKSSELKRYGYNPIKIPLENVYAFKLQNKKLTNVSPAIKKYLEKQLPNSQ